MYFSKTKKHLCTVKVFPLWARWEKARQIADELRFHKGHETIVRLLLIHACTLGATKQ